MSAAPTLTGISIVCDFDVHYDVHLGAAVANIPKRRDRTYRCQVILEPPPQADDARVMREAYAGDNAKSDRDADLNTMKVAYTRRWVAANAERPATQSSTNAANHTATSNWTW